MTAVLDDDPARRRFKAAQTLLNDAVAPELVAALEAEGIHSILLKGATIARWLYMDGGTRHYWDIDLLVSPSELRRAEAVVGAIGFQPLVSEPTRIRQESHHERWYRPADNVCVELHRGFVGIEASDGEFWDELARECEPLELGSDRAVVHAPSPAARALLVGLHAANHGSVGTPLEDLRRAVRQVPAETWREAALVARRLRAEPAFAAGLSLVPEGADLVTRLGLASIASAEVILRASVPPPTAMGFERLSQSAGIAGKLRYLAFELAPPPAILRQLDPLARRGTAATVAAYARRPFLLAAQAPRGFHAWRSARRRARRA